MTELSTEEAAVVQRFEAGADAEESFDATAALRRVMDFAKAYERGDIGDPGRAGVAWMIRVAVHVLHRQGRGMTDYQPGSFFLVSVKGRAGWGIGVAQAAAGKPSEFEHAGMIVNTDGATIEAEPGGAIEGNVTNYTGRRLLISDGPIQQWAQQTAATPEQIEAERSKVVLTALGRKGRKYSFLDYVALTALHLGLPSAWIRRRVAASKHELCSQMVDGIYLDSGLHLFSDGRLPGDVLPADLAAWAEDHQ